MFLGRYVFVNERVWGLKRMKGLMKELYWFGGVGMI